jgi:predicted nucleic acid-binding protein
MVIALDSNVFIAALSPHEQHSINAQQLIRDVTSGKHKAIASSILYGEVLSVSNSSEHVDLEDFLSHVKNLFTFSASDSICLKAGELRLEYGPKLKLPDAIHLSTALSSEVDLFVTNDEILAKVAQKLIPIKLLSEWA